MDEDSGRARYEFRRKIEELRGARGRATELISLYVPHGRVISDVVAYLRNEYAQSSNIKSRTTRKNVMWAIDSLSGRVRQYKVAPKNGLAFFVGTRAAGGDKTEVVSHVIEPPEPLNTYLYRCDSEFFLKPLEDMLVEHDTYGLIVIDRAEATIGMLKGKRIVIIKNKPSNVPRKHGKGGQSARRFERLIEEAAHNFFVKIAAICEEAFLPNIQDMRGIIIGGPGFTKEFFVKEGFLHHELQKKVIATLFDTGYTDEYGLKELMEKASSTMGDLDLVKEKKLIQKFMGEVRKSQGSLAAYGEREVARALKLGAVDILLISEGLRKLKGVFKCSSCGSENTVVLKDEGNTSVKCTKCGTAMELLKTKDMVSDYYDLAESSNTKVILISTESEEGELLIKAFGGVAVLLRFSISGGGA